jgi:hypothetical protein
MNLIVEQGFDPTKFNVDKAKQNVNATQVITKPDAVKRDTDKVDAKKPDVKKPEEKKPEVKKKHNSFIDKIDAEKVAISKQIMNAIQFYSSLLTYLQYFDIDEEAIQKLFSRKLVSIYHARYCDMIFRLANPTGVLLAATTKYPKRFDYFLSRNKTSTNLSYLQGFKKSIPSKNMNNSFKSLSNLFLKSSDFYDYVIEDIPLVTMNKLAGLGIIKNFGTASDIVWTIAFRPYSDRYIIQLVNTIYDNQIYGKPQSYLK